MAKCSDLNKIRPCVKQALENGARDEEHRKKMVFAITYELNRIGIDKGEIKQQLLEWDSKSFEPFSLNEKKRRLCGYVDWFLKHECKMGCKALEQYCIHESGDCTFNHRPINFSLSYDIREAIIFLDKEYKKHGYLMGIILGILLQERKKKGVETLFMGIRKIQSEILNKHNHTLDLMTILRNINFLGEAGFIEIVPGKRGEYGNRKSNQYKFLEWKKPDTKERNT